MNRKVVSGAMLTILLTGMSMLPLIIQPAKAIETIYIRPNGDVDPPTAPIERDGNLYTLTGDIIVAHNGVVVERNNIVIDGAGYSLQGLGGGFGFDIRGRNNITIKNTKVVRFGFGILVYLSDDNYIIWNTITGCSGHGIWLAMSLESTIYENNITNNGEGIFLYKSSNNRMFANKITNNVHGIFLNDTTDNIIVGNDILANDAACEIQNIFANSSFYHNNLIDNIRQVLWYVYRSYNNIWDNGYRSGGNYWSDQYHGDCADHYRGPYQNETGGDGIVDTPYVIDKNNQDNYPLMKPWTQVPPVEDTEAYIEYVNETTQELPDELFNKTEEDVPDIKNDFSDLFNDTLENINEGNYALAIEKLNTIKEKIYEEMVESAEREEIISLIDDLIVYLETLL